jgi:hypothetical protein
MSFMPFVTARVLPVLLIPYNGILLMVHSYFIKSLSIGGGKLGNLSSLREKSCFAHQGL